ncbi:hypothetical protein [Paraburkholderia unamae]|uniref:Uncharacterized protein n=1 Tax=Paraburkholderia unamae TaxID=219649 RepID=A0ACC6RGQ3_9BURK
MKKVGQRITALKQDARELRLLGFDAPAIARIMNLVHTAVPVDCDAPIAFHQEGEVYIDGHKVD